MVLDLVQVRRRLLAERDEIERRRAELRAEFAGVVAAASDVATDDEHDPEGATIAYERSKTAALISQATDHLADVERALRRLDDGRYEICETCGATIAESRLEARPVARTCITCAQRDPAGRRGLYASS